MTFLRTALVVAVLVLTARFAIAQSDLGSADMQIPPEWRVQATDRGSDAGGAILVSWRPHPEESLLTGYVVLRSEGDANDWTPLATVDAGTNEYLDETAVDGTTYYYHLDPVPDPAVPLDSGQTIVDAMAQPAWYFWSEPVQSSAQWFNWTRLNQFIVAGLISAAIIFFIAAARSGRQLYVRKIAGLQALEEAIGRATEMGRPILFIPGIQDMDDVQTIAGITILARVARTVAEYETTLNVPVSRSLVMTTARESIREAYASAGRPDAYSDNFVHYVTDEQFGYVAAVDGIIVREKPATCLYMGAFYAESLIMAETGSEIGAIQIAGTAQPAQLPFFVAACDYTLIGEELFAASAYLSGESRQLGSLKGQDVGKGIAMAALALGALLVTLTSLFPDSASLAQVADWVGRAFQVK